MSRQAFNETHIEHMLDSTKLSTLVHHGQDYRSSTNLTLHPQMKLRDEVDKCFEHLPHQIMHHSHFASSHNSTVDDEKLALQTVQLSSHNMDLDQEATPSTSFQ